MKEEVPANEDGMADFWAELRRFDQKYGLSIAYQSPIEQLRAAAAVALGILLDLAENSGEDDPEMDEAIAQLRAAIARKA